MSYYSPGKNLPGWVRFTTESNRKDNHGDCHGWQRHVHEFEGSAQLAEENGERHNHRFAGVTGEAIPAADGSHIHKICTRTDFFEEHFHFIDDETGPAIQVGNGKHVHFAKGRTSFNEGHAHKFQFATLIEDPLARDRHRY